MSARPTYTEEQERVLGERIAEIFRLRQDPDNKDRFLVEGGNKTHLGLGRVFLRLVDELESGVPPHQLFT